MPPLVWLVPALAAAFVALAWLFPRAVVRLLARVVVGGLYRFTVYHRTRLPASGPALLVANHVTYLDWLLIGVASPRPVRFVIWGSFYRNPVPRFLLSFGRHHILAVDNAGGRSRAMQEALSRMAAALAAGEVVVVFPEQTLTRTGAMLPFGRGLELVLKRAARPVPVVPVHLDNLWGSVWSWSDGRVFWKWPERPFRRRVAVYFGEPLTEPVTAAEARAAVAEAGADCGIAESDKLLPVPRQFVRQAATFRHLFRRACVDVSGGAEKTLTWGRTLVGVWALKCWLAKRVGPEQNVGIWLPTGLASALANVSLSCLGKTTVNLNYTAGPDLVKSALAQAGVTTVVTAGRFLARVPLEVPAGVTVLRLEDAMAAISPWANFVRFLAVVILPGWFLDRVVFDLGRLALDAPATILFSSGSTGEPKGVILTHRNVTANVDGFRRGVHFRDDDRMLVTLPFFHSFGHTVSLWATFAVGMEAVFFPDPRQAKEIGELSKKHACTLMLGTATFLRFYLRRADAGDFASMRLIVCGAEKLPVPLAEEFHAKFGVLPLEGYGCTELSPVVSVNMPDVTAGGVTQTCNTSGTVGQPIPNVVVKVFDCDTLDPLPHGAVGMLGVKGPNVMAGYLNRPDLTGRAVRGGWYMTGDIGKIEDDGFVRITGRVSRFAKIGGEMVPLERLDEEMHELLGSSADRVLVVAAVPCDKRGERVVVLHLEGVGDRLEGVFRDLRGRGLPNLWVPDRRDCYLVAVFPVLGTGKLDLKRLGELAREIAAVPA